MARGISAALGAYSSPVRETRGAELRPGATGAGAGAGAIACAGGGEGGWAKGTGPALIGLKQKGQVFEAVSSTELLQRGHFITVYAPVNKRYNMIQKPDRHYIYIIVNRPDD